MSTTYQESGRRTLITPEGVDLRVTLADIGARIGAMTLDLIFIILMFIAALFILIYSGVKTEQWETSLSLLILFAFFLRSFYFTAFEMSRRAATPGKRIMKIRVAARGKPRLSANSVFARNALREIEFFLPLSFLAGSGATGVDGWMSGLGLIWSCIFLFFLLFNKDRLRAGDLIAGTWVVKTPRPILAKDLASADVIGRERFAFTPAQVGAYGVKELHVLEDVLRMRDPETLQDVATRIRNKIGWKASGNEENIDFLNAYYGALRGRLETKLLMGVRRKDKFDTR
ncbi:MAG: RDD family protein [Litorimonas sp.]